MVPALVSALVAAVLALAMPAWVRRLPEPEPDPEPDEDSTFRPPAKIPYPDLASGRGFRVGIVVASAVVAALLGASLGWHSALLHLVPLTPIGAALAVIDWRTWYLPTRLIAPGYVLVLVAIGATAAWQRDADVLLDVALGWAVLGGFYLLLWWFTPGMAYGDVRLAGLLGLVLGQFGLGVVLLGGYAGFVFGAVGWLGMRLLGRTRSRHYPFGPFMLLGALVGLVCAGAGGGEWLLDLVSGRG